MEWKAGRKQRERTQLDGRDRWPRQQPEARDQQQQDQTTEDQHRGGQGPGKGEGWRGQAGGGLAPKPRHLGGKEAGRQAGGPGLQGTEFTAPKVLF